MKTIVILLVCLILLVFFFNWVTKKDDSWVLQWKRKNNNSGNTILFSLLYLNELDSVGNVVAQHKIEFIPQEGLTIGRYDSPESGRPLADVLIEGNKHSVKYVSRLHAMITLDSNQNCIFHDYETSGNGSVLLTPNGEVQVIDNLNINKHIGEWIYLGGYPDGVPITFSETESIHKYSVGIKHVNEMEDNEETDVQDADPARGKKYRD